jgi:hypothetical protein
MKDRGVFASGSLARHLARGAIGFGLVGCAFALTSQTGPISLLLAPLGLIALRGCPTCWIIGLIQTISAGRLERSCGDEGCGLHTSKESMDLIGVLSNHDLQGSLPRLAGKLAAVRRDVAHAVVAVHERMHAQDAGIQSCRGSCAVENAPGLNGAQILDATIECRADSGEIAANRVRRNSFQLSHPAACKHHAEERRLLAEASTIVRELASEDCSMPPADALGVHPQWGLPECPLRVVQDAGEFVPEGLPGLLG